MFSLMGNCWSSRNKGSRRHLTLAILGLDNAGKTVTTNILQGESMHTAPTVGFQKSELAFGKYNLTFFDLGGGKKIRAIWEKYFAEIHGIVYLVDSSDTDRIEESTTVFRQLLENPKIKGKPVLLLANKQDKEGAMDEVDICDQMKLEEIVNANKCPCRVEMCTATKGTGRKKDPAIKEGLLWLCDMINVDFERIGPRVEEDMKQQAEERRKELEEKRERVRRVKEEREKAEAEERLRTGAPARPESPADQPINGDPFKRINFQDLQNKENALKAEKKRKKLQKAANKNENQQSESKLTNGLSNNTSENLPNGLQPNDDDDEDIIIASQSPRHSKLPPLRNSSHHQGENLEGSSLKPIGRKEDLPNGARIPPVDNPEGFSNGRSELFSVQKPHNLKESSLRPLDVPDKPVEEVKKRRRRKVKKNKLAPLDGGVEDTPRPLDAHTSLPWHTPNPRTHPARLGTPKLQTTDENTDVQGGMLNWAMVEDLTEPTLDINYSNRYGQPNFDREDIVT